MVPPLVFDDKSKHDHMTIAMATKHPPSSLTVVMDALGRMIVKPLATESGEVILLLPTTSIASWVNCPRQNCPMSLKGVIWLGKAMVLYRLGLSIVCKLLLI